MEGSKEADAAAAGTAAGIAAGKATVISAETLDLLEEDGEESSEEEQGEGEVDDGGAGLVALEAAAEAPEVVMVTIGATQVPLDDVTGEMMVRGWQCYGVCTHSLSL